MECERVREDFVERLTGTLDPARSRAVDEHLAGCAACRAETERLSEMWRELGALAPVAASGGAASRLQRLIDARERGATPASPAVFDGRSRGSFIPRAALASSALAASLLVGLFVGRRSAEPSTSSEPPVTATQSTAASAKQQYLLLLEGPARTRPVGASPTAADSAAERAIVQEYGAWAGRLARAGNLVLAEKLSDAPVAIHSQAGVINTSRNPAEEVGGFFLIQVADSAEAHRIVRECPHLKYGGTVQLRRIEPT